jgi:hypothetical protein
MTMSLMGLHPTFDALSSLADQGDVEGARSRVGRHVARCAQCAATVAEIRELGDAARGVDLPGAPAGLWARIERAAEVERAAPARARETPPPDADAWTPAPALRPTRHVESPVRRGVRAGVGMLAAAVIVALVLLVPRSREVLQAGQQTGRWQFTPARPSPGQRVAVRYLPSVDDTLDSTVMVLGGADYRYGSLMTGIYRRGLLDSIGVLVRQRDGAYVGQIAFGPDSSVLMLMLSRMGGLRMTSVMSPEGRLRSRLIPVAILVAGDASGRPLLAALTRAAEFWYGGSETGYSVSDTLIKYYPAEPIGFATRAERASHRLLDDLIGFFRSGEREYFRFDRRFMVERGVSAEHELAMVVFANRIAEPAEVEKWVRRLVAEHPDDPRTLVVFANMLGSALARPNTVDTVRRALPIAETLYARNGGRVLDGEIASIASRVGDTATYQRWTVRTALALHGDLQGRYLGTDSYALADSGVRRNMRSALRARVASACRLPAGRYPPWQGVAAWRVECSYDRAGSYAALSAIALLDGRPAAALALADSSVTLGDSIGKWCRGSSGYRRRGEALLALHDTAAAVPELARGIGYGNWENIARADEIGRQLRGFLPAARWTAQVQAARAADEQCDRDANDRASAARDSARRATTKQASHRVSP